jgi:DNA-binding response OmpR family regulator
MHLLLVEDDPRMRRLLARLLGEDRHVVETAASASEAGDVAELPGIELIILDVGLPDGSGLDVARRVRKSGSATPILMLTARDAIQDRVAGLDAGADDYLVKPFAYAELSARIRALARRGTALASERLEAGVISLDAVTREVSVQGGRVDLSRREFSLLECLLRHVEQTLSRDQLLDHAWPYGVAVTPNTVDAYIHLLREKLGDAGCQIETVRGVGYRLRDGWPEADQPHARPAPPARTSSAKPASA